MTLAVTYISRQGQSLSLVMTRLNAQDRCPVLDADTAWRGGQARPCGPRSPVVARAAARPAARPKRRARTTRRARRSSPTPTPRTPRPSAIADCPWWRGSPTAGTHLCNHSHVLFYVMSTDRRHIKF